MSGNIYGERFVGARGVPAWHGLGTVIPEGQEVSVEEALRIGGVDYKYVSVPLGYLIPGTETLVETGRKVMVLREPAPDSPAWEELGVVSEGYRYLQNEELARGLDLVSKETGWKFETVGALGNGATVFMSLRVGEREVKGDKYDLYLVVSDGKVANRALNVVVAPTRVVCQNTLLASDATSTVNIKISHSGRVADNYSFWLDHVAKLVDAQERMFVTLDEMASVKIDDAAAMSVITAAYPLPNKNQKVQQSEAIEMMDIPDEAKAPMLERLADEVKLFNFWEGYARRHQESGFDLYRAFNSGQEVGGRARQEMPKKTLQALKETPYAALQAVTELADWGGRANAEVAGRSSLFGEGARIKRRGWEAAKALI